MNDSRRRFDGFILSFYAWFLSWLYTTPWAHGMKELHELFAGLIEAYVIGHGGMGMLHLLFQFKNQENR